MCNIFIRVRVDGSVVHKNRNEDGHTDKERYRVRRQAEAEDVHPRRCKRTQSPTCLAVILANCNSHVQ